MRQAARSTMAGPSTAPSRALRALIDAGASLQLTDRQGQTPLMLAKSRGYAAMVAMLEKAGAR